MIFSYFSKEPQKTLIYLLLLLSAVLFLRLFISLFIKRVLTKYLNRNTKERPRTKKRINTLTQVINNLILSLGLVLAIFLILRDIINVTPLIASLLASAGIIGFAISFGAQSLVKDLITGFFFLAQDQFGVGDIVQTNNIIGTITSITLRTVTVRDFSGNVTIFSNSVINQITNLSKDYSKFDMIFITAMTTKVDDIIGIMKKAGEQIESDDSIKPVLLDKMELLGVESLSDGKMGIRIGIKTIAGMQFEVGRKYRYELKKLLEEKDINT